MESKDPLTKKAATATASASAVAAVGTYAAADGGNGEDEPSPFWQGKDPTDTDAMKVARFRAKRKSDFIPEWKLRSGDQFQVRYCFINGVAEPFMQNFDYPIEAIQLIHADPNIIRRYKALFQVMHDVYEALYAIRFPNHVLRPYEIVAGRCAIAQVFPLSRQMQHEFRGLLYQRVQILETFGERNSQSHHIKCYLVDIGTVINVDFRHLFYMLDDFARLPRQVVHITVDELAEWKMHTQLRSLFLNGLYLHNSTITLKIHSAKTPGACGRIIGDVRMESSRFPGVDFVQLIKERMTRLLKEPTRTNYRKLEIASQERLGRLLSFTSVAPVPFEGVNFATPREPVVYPVAGNVLDFVVVGYGTPGLLHIVPYLSHRTSPLAKFNIDRHFEQDWVKNTRRCHCLKDGSYFCVKTKGGYERCKVLDRAYGNAFLLTQQKNKKIIRSVRIVLLDTGDVATVKASDLRFLPPEYALAAPAQAVVANWCRTDLAGKCVFFEWDDRDWDAFGRFAANNRVRFFGKVLKTSRDLIGRVLVNVQLLNPKTIEVLDPASNFWIKSEPRKRYM